MTPLVLVDGDCLVYQAAFAAQHTFYHFDGKQWESADACKEYIEAKGGNYRALRREGVIPDTKQVLPEKVALKIAKQKLNEVLLACKSRRYKLFMTGVGNYRDALAVTQGYKANRLDSVKPVHFAAVREYYIERCKGIVVDEQEADDAIGIAAWPDPDTIIASIDKDLNQLPGRHYDWKDGRKYTVSETDALWFFMCQLLTGDSTDNVPGLPGIGEKKANNILEHDRNNLLLAWDKVKVCYESSVNNWQSYMNEMGRLLWIRHRPDEIWDINLFEGQYLG